MRKVIGVVVMSSIGFFAACGGGETTPQNPQPQGSASAAESGSAAPSASAQTSAPSGKPWDQMSHAERLDQMKTVVLPKLQGDFQAFDAKKYEKFSCTTCHGERIKSGNFTMPNPDLPKIGAAEFKKFMDTKPEMTKFMMSKVEPDTAAAINLKPYDPATKTGFGCGGCHPHAE